MQNEVFQYKRKSYIELGNIYFWTATINKWYKLLNDDEFKEVIMSSLNYLSKEGKIDVFGFVLMPNHIHMIWRIKELNGKESSQGSFLKYTAHTFKQILKVKNPKLLADFRVDAGNKNYEFWQRDSLAILLYTKEVAFQKLEYIHNNPLAEHWKLVSEPSDYKYSSARFYDKGIKEFVWLKDIREEF